MISCLKYDVNSTQTSVINYPLLTACCLPLGSLVFLVVVMNHLGPTRSLWKWTQSLRKTLNVTGDKEKKDRCNDIVIAYVEPTENPSVQIQQHVTAETGTPDRGVMVSLGKVASDSDRLGLIPL